MRPRCQGLSAELERLHRSVELLTAEVAEAARQSLAADAEHRAARIRLAQITPPTEEVAA